MEIKNLKHLLKVKLLKIKQISNDNLENIKSQILNVSSPQQKKSELKLDFIKDANNKEKSLLSYNSVKFLPKRLSQINFDEPFSPIISSNVSTKITNNYQINFSEKFNNVIKKLRPDSGKKFDLDRIPDFTDIKFKNEYRIKFDMLIFNFENLKTKSDNINEINKYKYYKYWEKAINCLRNQASFLFSNSIINLEKEESRDFISNIEKYNYFINKLFNLLINEINSKAENNNNISKLKRDLETENFINNTEIKRLKGIVNNPKIKKLYSNKQKVEEQIGKAKLKFLKDKNDYILIINDLTKEIQNLYKLLNKNKEYYNKFIQSEIKVKSLDTELKDLKSKYSYDTDKLNEKNFIAKVYIEKLNQQIEELNNEIDELKKVEKGIINYKIQIKNLEAYNQKIFENYLMTKEELESYIYLKVNKFHH